MSVNPPPNPNVNTFNNEYWISGDNALTQSEADLRYLKWPVAQGTENLQAVNVNGAADFNSTINLNGTADFNSTINVNGVADFNSTINVDGKTTLNGILEVNNTSSFNNIVNINNVDNTKRKINTTFYNLLGNTSNAYEGRIYEDNGTIFYENDVNNSQHIFTTTDASGIQKQPLLLNSNGASVIGEIDITDGITTSTLTPQLWNASSAYSYNLKSSTIGAIPYQIAVDSTDFLAPSSTVGLVLTSNGPGVPPSWGVGGGGSSATINITDTNTNANFYPTFVDSAGLSKVLRADVSSTPMTYNPSSGSLTCTNINAKPNFIYNNDNLVKYLTFSAGTGNQDINICNTGGAGGIYAIPATNTIGATNFSGLASNSTQLNVTNTNNNSTHYLTFVDTNATGQKSVQATNGILVNPNTNIITATGFNGLATNASNVNVTSDNTNGNYYLTFVKTLGTGNKPLFIDDINGPLTYNPDLAQLIANNISVNSALTVTGTSEFNNNITMTNSNAANRNINATFYNMLGLTSDVYEGRIYEDNGFLYYENAVNSGKHIFTCKDSLGVAKQPLELTSDGGTLFGTLNVTDGTITNILTNTTWSGTSTKATNIVGGAGGSIPYQSAVDTTVLLPNGTLGQVLTSQGGTAGPIWATPSGGGNASTIDVTNTASPSGTYYPTFVDSTGLTKTLRADTGPTAITYDPATATLSCQFFNGLASSSSLAAYSLGITTTSDNSNGNYYIPFSKTGPVSATQLYLDDTSGPLTYNPSTSNLSCASFTGSVIGNASSATNVLTTLNSTNTDFYPVFQSAISTGNNDLFSNTTISMNPSTSTVTATNFSGTATKATNIVGGAGGSIPYQSAVDTTVLLANGSAGQYLQSNGTTLAPSWVTPSAPNPNITDTNLSATYYPIFVAGTGTQALFADTSTGPLSYNPASATLTCGVTAVTTGLLLPTNTTFTTPTAGYIGQIISTNGTQNLTSQVLSATTVFQLGNITLTKGVWILNATATVHARSTTPAGIGAFSLGFGTGASPVSFSALFGGSNCSIQEPQTNIPINGVATGGGYNSTTLQAGKSYTYGGTYVNTSASMIIALIYQFNAASGVAAATWSFQATRIA
jgi:hypothetical protein